MIITVGNCLRLSLLVAVSIIVRELERGGKFLSGEAKYQQPYMWVRG